MAPGLRGGPLLQININQIKKYLQGLENPQRVRPATRCGCDYFTGLTSVGAALPFSPGLPACSGLRSNGEAGVLCTCGVQYIEKVQQHCLFISRIMQSQRMSVFSYYGQLNNKCELNQVGNPF